VCPQCGREQYRVCYCSHRIPVIAAVCPYCGADWSHSKRVRRKSHRHSLSYRKLAQFAGVGAFVALMAAMLGNAVITGLAQHSLPADRSLPPSLIARVGLALQTVGQGLGGASRWLAQVGGGLLPVLAVSLIGAGAGVMIYLVRARVARLHRRTSSYKRKRRSH